MAAMAALRMRTRAGLARQFPLFSRAYGTSLPIPNVPEGTAGTEVFHSRMQPVKYSMSNPKWFFLFFVANTGAYAGHYFYLYFLMYRNPPNPPRNKEDTPPEKHIHEVDED
mmetsp:Transcript_103832/g.180388  ORF Transcript_103832/g.180388 Transcript_103832/m.180388 type:complete len:111 (-) Transcript_103832:149-481(-)